MNQIVLVGRLSKEPELRETEDGKKVSNITLAITRNYKNAEGEYDTDFIDCVLWNSIAENTVEYVNKGDIIGVKGRVQTNITDGKKHTNIVAEKVTFLSSKKDLDNENNEEQER